MTGKWRAVLVLSLLGNVLVIYVGYKAMDYRAHVNVFLERYLNLVAELSGREVYEADNARLCGASPDGDRVVFFGTQVVKSWPLARYFPDWEVVNRGVERQRLAGFLLRFRPDVIELAPRAVVIEVSSYHFRPNRTVRENKDYIASLAELARYHGIEPILATVIPPRRGVQEVLGEELGDYLLMDSLAEFNQWLVSYCEANSFGYADWNAVMSDHDGYLGERLSSAGIDPNDQGYLLMAEEVRRVLGALAE